MYDFDTVIDRRDSCSLKWDSAERRGMPADVLPMWVADMDFAAPPVVTRALARVAQFGVFGYSEADEHFCESVHSWFLRRFSWDVSERWQVLVPGVVPALYLAVQAYTEPGDAVLIQSPVYYPFREAIHDTGRVVASNPLRGASVAGEPESEGGNPYTIDFDDFEAKAADPRVKLFILCNPHNPVGRVWTADELRRMGEICLKHKVIVVADEIHADFVFPGYQHTVFAQLSDELADNCVIATAPSKTFNLAGLQLATVFIPNEKLRRRYLRAFRASGLSQPGLMGIVACRAAYEGGEDWLEELLVYLQGNFDYLDERLRAEIPAIKLVAPEGSYLAWLDCREMSLGHRELDDFMVKEARLWLDGGTMFGPEGAGFQRMNLACPRATLSEALDRLTTATR
ncbi:MAG: pyridoxal phosphate-dependent aminotransferase [Actinomycetes bacterium]|jgi:cystathionine beta-lyase|nr:pyridoxal phosphate-dependent aminotransferase [Actinomycetes bacterium]